MYSSQAEEATAIFDAIEAGLDRLDALGFDSITTPELFTVLQRGERVGRRLPAHQHRLIDQINEQSVVEEIGGPLPVALADRLRISPAEARRRVRDAGRLGDRMTLTGQPVGPLWPATAAAQRAGAIGAEHIREIGRFFHQLPAAIDDQVRAAAEAELAGYAATLRPDELRVAAERMAGYLNPDGQFSDADRARKRGLSIGRQDIDGMSPISGYLTPEARANLDAVLAKLAAPGMCNPDDQTPTINGSPLEAAVTADSRSRPQRNHDALNAACRSVLSSGALGTHHGLPVSVVVSTTLQELQAGAGKAITGGGTWLPMGDLIRMASHAHHYLAVFDNHSAKPLYLGHTKRIATAAQRIVLHAKDRGCTFPGCTAPGYECQVHHVDDWARGGATNADDLTFGCTCHHPLAEKGWKTRKRADGTTEWIPPPHLDTGKPRTNRYHHPERYLTTDNRDED
jgi:Domain of unknown function (DUF222)